MPGAAPMGDPPHVDHDQPLDIVEGGHHCGRLLLMKWWQMLLGMKKRRVVISGLEKVWQWDAL